MENNADKYLAIESAKKVLKENGYFVDNLWHVDDVRGKYKCSDDVAQSTLYNAMTNEATMEQVWFSIDEFASIEGLESSDYED